jgi:hypothetical protein
MSNGRVSACEKVALTNGSHCLASEESTVTRDREAEATYCALEVDEAQPLADVVAYHHHIRVEEAPLFWTGCVICLYAVLVFAIAQLIDERLILVPQQLDRRPFRETLPTLTELPFDVLAGSHGVGHGMYRSR